LDGTLNEATTTLSKCAEETMKYVEAPDTIHADASGVLFLAGGITGCPDWQARALKMLKNTRYTILNPRRHFFPTDDHTARLEQVVWEYHGLRRADVILFWFPSETVQPVALYELGAALEAEKPVVVGADAKYVRRLDLELQLRVARPTAGVHDTLEKTVECALELLKRRPEMFR
jgi:hypothetical protein